MAANERFNKLRHEEPCSFLQQEEIGLWSLLFFDWMTETFKTGTLRPLQQSDLLPIEKQNRTKVLTEKFQQLWNDEQNACVKSGKQPRLWKCVVKMLRGEEILIIAIFSMVHKIGSTLRCLLLGFILSDLISNNGDKTMTYTCAVLLGVVSMGERFASHSQRWMSEVFGARICCALKGIVYSKITRVGLRALQEFEEGHVIDLLSNDITLMEMAPEWIFDMISLIYLVPVVLYLFVNLFRWEALLGLLFLVGLFPYFLCGSHLVGNLRRKTAGLSDRRISRISELMSGIRTVKTQALEQYFARRINKIRKQELKKIRQKYLVVSAIEGMVCSSSSLAVFLSSLLLVLGNWELTPVNAFMLLSFMNVLRTTFSVYLKQGLLIVFEASVSLRRIEEFLLLDDLLLLRDNFFASKILPQSDFTRTIEGQTNISSWQEEKQPTKFNSSSIEKEQVTPSKVVEDALFVSSLTYKMTERDNQHVLCDVSFVTPTQSLTIICGRVGSGKSTLLSAIAGEVKLSNGTVKYPGTLAYVPQVPWVFSGTIRENILFGESDDPHWYSTVVEACALKEDIELFPNKDDTLVGQRGVVLSGGQKARVSLARAVYSCADVYVLDDPLSAVDQKVGDEIFSRCICGLLGDKIRVLVSHHRRYLQEADEIIVMEKGRVLEKRRPQLGEAKYTATIFCNTSVNEFRAEPDFFTSKTSANKPKGLEILDEDRASGNVSFQLYWDYFTSGVHPLLIFTLVALFVFTQPAIIFPDIWLSILSRKTLEQQQKVDNIVIYAGVTAAALVFTTIRVFLFFIVSLKSSQRLHGRMVQAILHARLSFFDTNPPGRILNRFSRDITSMDEQLPQKFILCIQDMLFVISAVLIPAISNPWLLLIFFPTIVAFLLLGRYYLKTSRELKRLESICRSPVYSHFTETMAGLDTIRTRRMQKKFVEEFYRHQDLHNQAIYMVFGSTRWFGLRVDLLCVPFLTCVALGSVAFSMDPAIAGLSLSYVMETLDVVQYAIRQFSEVENIMTSVERVITYTKLESEPGYKTKTLPFTYWPRDGQVTLRNVTLAYYEHGPQVLKNLNFSIHGNSRVGVIGRTGAGKSSLVAAFLRMPDAQGDVIIDGVKINDINLKESRRSISVLSQVPVLFCGSLRQNLDPMNQYEDVTLWAALEDVQLKSFLESLNGQLEYELQEGATNLSAGERQLVCLARTLLQHNRIVILDEPTAHVDPITEQTLWKAVHEKLNNCTVITIAHRLDTIKTCDTILVMREGEIAEFGTFDSLMGKGGYVSWLKNYR